MTVKDYRHIEFDEEAICDALILCPNISQKFGYMGQDIESVRFNTETHSVSIILNSTIVEITSNQLIALLLFYCKSNNIPTPKSSQKNIFCKSNSVVISFFSSFTPKRAGKINDSNVSFQGSRITSIAW